MSKNVSKFLIVGLVLAGSIGIFVGAQAISPTLSVYSIDSNTVQVTVYGDSNSSVVLYYQTYNTSNWQSQYLGSTNSNGHFTTNIGSAYNINPGSSVYVIVNNQQSPNVVWPQMGQGGNLSLSQTNLTLYPGQTSTVTAYNGNSIYVSNNSNSNVATATVNSGNQISVNAINTGSTTISICSSYPSSMCASLYVTVQYSGGGGGSLSLDRSNVTVGFGQSANVTVTGGSMPYSMFASPVGIFDAILTNNKLTIIGRTFGSGTLNICSSGGGGCVNLYVNVSTSGNNNNNLGSVVTFSQNNPVLTLGQSMDVFISGGNGSYTLAYNSDYNSVQASLNGNRLNIRSSAVGRGVVVVCSGSNNCGAVSVSSGTGSVLGTQDNWTSCGSEGQYCYFSGTRQVRYGANGNYFYRTASNGIGCNNATFGDPLFGYVKQCSYQY